MCWVFCCCLCLYVCGFLFFVFFPRGHQHSGSVLRNSSNYLTFAGINNTCAFSGFILIKPFWSGARPEPAPGKAGRRLVAQDGKSGGQLRAGWEGADEAGGPWWQRWTPVGPSGTVGQRGRGRILPAPSLNLQPGGLPPSGQDEGGAGEKSWPWGSETRLGLWGMSVCPGA